MVTKGGRDGSFLVPSSYVVLNGLTVSVTSNISSIEKSLLGQFISLLINLDGGQNLASNWVEFGLSLTNSMPPCADFSHKTTSKNFKGLSI
jgi:hypothetical protein